MRRVVFALLSSAVLAAAGSTSQAEIGVADIVNPNSFLRGGSVIAYSPAALARIAPHVQQLADKEGLTAHRASVDIRLESMRQG